MKKISKLKFLFIYPDLAWNNINFSPAIMTLSSYLKKHIDIDVSLIHLNEVYAVKYDLEDILKKVKNINPDIIGFSCTSYQYMRVEEIAAFLKKKGVSALMLLGGSHATINPDDIEKSSLDVFCIGEGELSLLELCKKFKEGKDITNIQGCIFKTESGIINNPLSKVLQDLNELPIRDYELMNTKRILKIRNGWLNISFSRGCPYSCSFCINQALRVIYNKSNKGSYFRCMSIDNIISELEHWAKYYKGAIKIFNFDDDLLMLKKDWFIELISKYKKKIYDKYGIEYVINGRANLIDQSIADVLFESGCYEVQIGFESGSDELRNLMLKKQITTNQLLKTFSLLRNNNIRTLAYTMLGIPGETHNSIKETLSVLKRLKPTLIRMTIFDPFLKTPIHDYCQQHNLLKNETNINAVNHFGFSNLKFDDLSELDILKYHLFFPWLLNNDIKYCKDAIKQFDKLTYNELQQAGDAILDLDKQISDKLLKEKVPHFRYFDKNKYYYQYVEFDK